MKKYRRNSQPVANVPDLPKNPIPWTTKILVGLSLLLMLVFFLLLVVRKGQIPILTSLIKTIANAASQEETQTPGVKLASQVPTATFPPGSPWLTAITITTIYGGPGEDQPKIGILEGGEQARILGKDQDGNWWAIWVPYVEEGRGWVSDAQVQSYDTNGVIVLSEDESLPEVNEGTPGPETPMISAIANANIRSGPGLEFVRIGILAAGQQAEILGQDPDGFWWMIKAPNVEGERGWISRDYVIARNTKDVPVIGTSSIQFGAIPTPPSGAPSLRVGSVINIRSGPGTNFAIIGKLAPEQSAEIVGVSPDGAWWAIKIPAAQNQRGWVSAQFVVVENTEGVPIIR